jgi:hypothetical protein
MIVRKDIIQGTPEWLELKWGKIGGSTSKGLFIASDTLLYEVLAELTEDFQIEADPYMSPMMLNGVNREPLARAEMSKFVGIEFQEVGWLQCEEIPLLGISPDGITEDETITCEVKCPGAKKHIQTVHTREIPSDNIHQCLHYFTINPKLVKHYFGSFRPESAYPLFVKELTLDSIIDLGTKAKPNCKTIREWVQIAKKNACELQVNLEIALKNMEKI